MKSIQVGLFSRRQKELFDQMSARSPIPINANPTHECVLSNRPQAQSQNSSWRLVSRPYAFGIVGLAIAVFLWGYGYKLSLYHCHSGSSSNTTVAKLWIETRNPSATTASVSEAKSHLFPGSQALFVLVQERPRLNRAVAHSLPLTARCIEYLVSLIPSRSPPPHLFGLA
jgi:hypothetical protein